MMTMCNAKPQVHVQMIAQCSLLQEVCNYRYNLQAIIAPTVASASQVQLDVHAGFVSAGSFCGCRSPCKTDLHRGNVS